MFSSKTQTIIAAILFVAFLALWAFGAPDALRLTALGAFLGMTLTAVLQLQHERHMKWLREYEATLHPPVVVHPALDPDAVQRYLDNENTRRALNDGIISFRGEERIPFDNPFPPIAADGCADDTDDANDDDFALVVDEPEETFDNEFESAPVEGTQSDDPDGYMTRQETSYAPRARAAVTQSPDDIDSPEIDPSTAAGPFAHGTVSRDSPTQWQHGAE